MGTLLVAIVVFGLIGVALYHTIRTVKQGGCPGCNDKGCGCGCGCSENKDKRN